MRDYIAASMLLSRQRARWFGWLTAALIVFISSLALAAWTPPPLRGHVVDEANALTPQETSMLSRKLEQARRQTGFAVVVYLLPQLPEGLSIEDVGYQAGNAWGVGSKGGDEGVLLIAALGEHKLRIETGKGAGGALTDIASSHISRDVIGPLLKEGRTYDAVNRGTDAILKELVTNTEGGKSERGRAPSAGQRPPTIGDYAKLGIFVLIGIGVLVLAIISPAFRELLFFMLFFGGRGGGGGGGSRDDDDYRGGGGRFGGGGSTDDY